MHTRGVVITRYRVVQKKPTSKQKPNVPQLLKERAAVAAPRNEQRPTAPTTAYQLAGSAEAQASVAMRVPYLCLSLSLYQPRLVKLPRES